MRTGIDLWHRLRLAIAVAPLIVIMAFGVYVWRTGARLEDLGTLGYPGVFLVMLISGAGTFAPFPGQAAIMAAGLGWNPGLVGLAAGLGNATGELAGFAAGRAGSSLLEKNRGLRRLGILR